jgi:hypothetical protein
VKRRDKFFLAVKTMRELFALPVCLVALMMRFVKLLILGMRLHKRGWRGKRVLKGFLCSEKSVAQGERDGFYKLGHCYRDGLECEKDLGRAKENYLVAAELGDVYAMGFVGRLLGTDDPQGFVWFGRAAVSGYSITFLDEMSDQIRNFNSGTGHANVVFAIGRALKGHISNEKRTIFRNPNSFGARIGPANQALHFYEFQLQFIEKRLTTGQLLD